MLIREINVTLQFHLALSEPDSHFICKHLLQWELCRHSNASLSGLKHNEMYSSQKVQRLLVKSRANQQLLQFVLLDEAI